MIRTRTNAGPAPRFHRVRPARSAGLRVVVVADRAGMFRALNGDSPVLLLNGTAHDLDRSRAAELLQRFDAVLGATLAGSWWAFGVNRPADAAALTAIPLNWRDSGALTLAVLRLDLRVAMLPTLREPLPA